MVWRGISIERHTHLYRLSNSTPSVKYWDEILGPTQTLRWSEHLWDIMFGSSLSYQTVQELKCPGAQCPDLGGDRHKDINFSL